MLDGTTEKDAEGVWLWAVFSFIVIAVLEFILFAATIPTDWVRHVADTELRWLHAAQGPISTDAILARAASWYDALFIQTGVVSWSYRLIVPDPHMDPGAGFEPLRNSAFWDWLRGRLDVIWAVIAQALQRLAMLLSWWPFLLLLTVGAVGDGWLRRQRRQHSFAYASPLAHHVSFTGWLWTWIAAGVLLLAPIPLPALGIPVLGAFSAALAALAVANTQKRL